VYLIDLGLAKQYRASDSLVSHVPFRRTTNLSGTATYASINNHQGIEQTRRDDLEGMGYMFLFFLRGYLPWQNIKGMTKKQRYEKIKEIKLSTPIPVLCSGLPPEFCKYFEYCRELGYDETPNYFYLSHCLFKRRLTLEYFIFDRKFDWMVREEEAAKTVTSASPPSSSSPYVGYNQYCDDSDYDSN